MFSKRILIIVIGIAIMCSLLAPMSACTQDAIPETRASSGTKFSFNKTFDINAEWDTDDISVVVLIQSTTKVRKGMANDPGSQFDSYEVIQSTIDTLDKSVKGTGSSKRVLGETFTATWCGYCPGAIGAQDRIVSDSSYFPDHYTLIEWHSSSSEYNLGNSETDLRFDFYNWGGGIPFSVFDGDIAHIGGSADPNNEEIDVTFKGYIDERKTIESPISISTFGQKNGASGWINVAIEVLSTPSDEEYEVNFVVVEDLKMEHAGAMYRYTARDVLPSDTIQPDNPEAIIVSNDIDGDEVEQGKEYTVAVTVNNDDPVQISVNSVEIKFEWRDPPYSCSNPLKDIASDESHTFTISFVVPKDTPTTEQTFDIYINENWKDSGTVTVAKETPPDDDDDVDDDSSTPPTPNGNEDDDNNDSSPSEKGASVPYWVWIIGPIIVFVLVVILLLIILKGKMQQVPENGEAEHKKEISYRDYLGGSPRNSALPNKCPGCKYPQKPNDIVCPICGELLLEDGIRRQ